MFRSYMHILRHGKGAERCQAQHSQISLLSVMALRRLLARIRALTRSYPGLASREREKRSMIFLFRSLSFVMQRWNAIEAGRDGRLLPLPMRKQTFARSDTIFGPTLLISSTTLTSRSGSVRKTSTPCTTQTLLVAVRKA